MGSAIFIDVSYKSRCSLIATGSTKANLLNSNLWAVGRKINLVVVTTGS